MADLIIIFAKQPIPGKTKTRLTPLLTREEAAHLYHAFLLDKIASLAKVNADVAIAYYPAAGHDYFAAIAPGFHLIEQVGSNLRARLSDATLWGFDQGYSGVMVADGDSPTLPPDFLNEMFELLNEADVVIGPAEDGGYYGLAMNKPYIDLFNITFSTPNVAGDTAAIAEEMGLNLSWYENEWYDVDLPNDLTRLYDDLEGRVTPTAHYLSTLIEKYPDLIR